MTPVQAAFSALVVSMHIAGACPMPREIYNSDVVTISCQHSKDLKAGNRADSCYDAEYRITILPTSCERDVKDTDAFCRQKACHESYRHIKQACLHKTFSEAESSDVIKSEDCLEEK